MMKNDFGIAITQLSAERNLPRDTIVAAIEGALASTFRKELEEGFQNVSVHIEEGSGAIQITADKTVVEHINDPSIEINLEAARLIQSDVQINDEVAVELHVKDAGRIAAQTTKQVVLQRLRAAQTDLAFEEFTAKKFELQHATVQKVDGKQVILDLGGKAQALLVGDNQVPSERYRSSQRLKVLIVDVQKTSRGPQILASRSHKDLLKRLFELEVPEISNGAVAIRSVAREAGVRSKVAVEARQEGIDAVGSCVGLRGARIQSIVNELQGEKIDVVQWSNDPTVYVANALSPAQSNRVIIKNVASVETAEVIVPDNQLSLAIGREGQNARLAARLTGWRIDLKSYSEVVEGGSGTEDESIEENTTPEVSDLTLSEEVVNELEADTKTAAIETNSTEEPNQIEVEQLQVAVNETDSSSIDLETHDSIEAVEHDDPSDASNSTDLSSPDTESEEIDKGAEAKEEKEAFDFQAWVRSQQPKEERPTLRFAEDILPDRGGASGRRNRGRNSGNNPSNNRGRKSSPPGNDAQKDNNAPQQGSDGASE
jgi:N utilization substance protein A